MKKFLFLSAIAAVTLASCSEDDLGGMSTFDNNTIAFATHKAKSMTRSGVTINSIDNFTVSAVNADKTSYFANEEFAYDNAAGVFKSATPHYWPTTGTLSFYAISDPGTYSADENNVPSYSYSNWEAEKDLVAATVLAGEKEIPYPLNFQHVTSQIIVGAEAEDKEEALTYKLVSVELTAPSTGIYSFADATGGIGSWVIDNTKTSTYSYEDALPMSFKQNGQIELSSCYWNILPVTDGELYFRVQYQVLQNGKLITDYTGGKYKECVIKNPGLLSGKIYRYNFILTRGTDEEITFTTTMSDWEDGNASLENIYDPALTYVTFTDGTTKAYDFTGSITSNTPTGLAKPTEMIENVKEAVSIKIGNKVTELGNNAFAGCEKLAHVEIPGSVTRLGEYAFCYCHSLTDIELHEGLKEIAKSCFHGQNGWHFGCEKLASIDLPSTVEVIGEMAFQGCPRLTSITLPNSLKEIGKSAFADTPLKSVTFGNGDLLIKEQAFSACNDLETLMFNGNVTLETNAFRQNVARNVKNAQSTEKYSKLKSVVFNGNVTLDGFAVFWGCTNLSSITLNTSEVSVKTSNLTDIQNAWSSTTAENAMGYNTRESGTNKIYAPATATFTAADLDLKQPVLFDTNYCGFSLNKTL